MGLNDGLMGDKVERGVKDMSSVSIHFDRRWCHSLPKAADMWKAARVEWEEGLHLTLNVNI